MKKSSQQSIQNILELSGVLGRPITCIEIIRAIPEEEDATEVLHYLDAQVAGNKLNSDQGFYWKKEFALSANKRKDQDLLIDMKWKKLQKLSSWFRHVPFFRFVMVSGSMSLGVAHINSDFDIVTGVQAGRIFTARYLSSAIYSLLHARRLDDLQASSPDKLCFNHFVTERSYTKEPHNYYRRELYRNMIPVWCVENSCRDFIRANSWSGIGEDVMSNRHRGISEKSMCARFLEYILQGRFGDFIERRVARPIAMKRLSAYVSRKSDRAHEMGERVIINDEELEFHFVLNWEYRFRALQ